MNVKNLFAVVALVLVSLSSRLVLADPYDDEVLKFQQLPMIATPIEGVTYFGHDELSTATLDTAVNQYYGTFMADDFADKFDTPVFHVTWWGSYLDQQTQMGGVKRFLISFEKDVPAPATGGFSHPGAPILSQIVSVSPVVAPTPPPAGTFTESLVRPADPILGEALYKYNAELAIPFQQLPDTVYWLKIVALVNPQEDGFLQWGWHNRDYTIFDPLASAPPAVMPGEHPEGPLPDGTKIWHFQDDAVSGTVIVGPPAAGGIGPTVVQDLFAPKTYVPPFDGPSPIIEYSKDLAFELHTRVPEPSSVVLLLLGGGGMLGFIWRKRR
jgi:PEP-CTERM motif